MEHREPQLYGVMAEFETVQQFMHAAEQVRDAGYQHMDAYAPFPVEGLSEALGLKRNERPMTVDIAWQLQRKSEELESSPEQHAQNFEESSLS